MLALCLVAACDREASPGGEVARSLPPMRWDHRDEAARWTAAAFAAMDSHGGPLISMVPTDIADWCPAYPVAGTRARQAFWIGLLSALAKHESTWNPRAVGGGGRWFGLVQISPATARWHGCRVTSGEGLLKGGANIGCAIRIAAAQVPKAGTVAGGMRDWGPFHSAAKRAEMSAWTRAQPYCKG